MEDPDRRTGPERAWDKYIGRSKNRAMIAFGKIARAKGLSMTEAADRSGVTIKAFQGYFKSTEPKLPTMTGVAKGLDLRPRVARALLHELTPQDVETWRVWIRAEISSAVRLLGENGALEASDAFDRWSRDKKNRQPLAQACAAIILAIDNVPSSRETDAVRFGSLLDPVEHATRQHGFSLCEFTQDEKLVLESQLMGISWFNLLVQTLGISNTDLDRLRQILAPYGALHNLDDLLAEVFDKSEQRLKRLAAETAAEEAYREALEGRLAWEYLTEEEYMKINIDESFAQPGLTIERSRKPKKTLGKRP